MSADDALCLPGLPKDAGGPVFRAPWEAKAFGLTLTLFERGCFTWKEWTQHLSAEIAAARHRGEADDGNRYYEYWLHALEKLAAEKGLTTFAEMLARKEEWDRAARSTPHGKPILLPVAERSPAGGVPGSPASVAS
jgi:nitrile hydratase accessory protein